MSARSVGLTDHFIPKTLDHGTSREEVDYVVAELFMRGGIILMPFF